MKNILESVPGHFKTSIIRFWIIFLLFFIPAHDLFAESEDIFKAENDSPHQAVFLSVSNSHNQVVNKELDCVQKHLDQKGQVTWNNICYSSDDAVPVEKNHYQAVNQALEEHSQDFVTINDSVQKLAGQLPYEENPETMVKSEEISNEKEKAIQDAFYIAAGLDYNQIHYSEWSESSYSNKLDEDYGKQDGSYYAVGYKSGKNFNYEDWVFGRPFIEGYYREFGDIIHYKGALIGGGAYNGDDRSKVTEFGVKVGGYKNVSDKSEAYGFIDIGRRIWNRGEDELPSYHERYTWGYTGFGAGIDYRVFPRLSLGAEGELFLGYGQKMHANILDLTFNLGTVWGYDLKMPIKYYLLKNLSLDVTPYFTYWSIKASNVVGGYYEPDSKTHIEGVKTGITLSF